MSNYVALIIHPLAIHSFDMASLIQLIFTPIWVVSHCLFVFFFPDRPHEWIRELKGNVCGIVHVLNTVPFNIFLEVLIVLSWLLTETVEQQQVPLNYS